MATIPLTRKKLDVDMTQGSIARHLFSFALPLLLGNIFQQLYNTVDTWVVGNFASNEAFSAVGSVTPIINILIGVFTGLSTGAGAVISQFYGARQEDRVRDTVHSAILITFILGALFTLLAIAAAPMMLRLMKMPENVFPHALTYLRIYFSGIIGLLLYNMGSAILRAVGDSKRPFLFLLVAAVLNTVLDLVFVLWLRMGVTGVALATIIAQVISATLVLICLMRSNECVRLSLSKMRLHPDVLKKVFTIGVPTAMQMGITSFSNVFVQSYINHFGDNFMSGWTAYLKIDQVIFLPIQSLGLAVTTFVGQNLGANQPDRARKSVGTALLMAVTCTLALITPIILFAPQLVAFFNAKPEVVDYGTLLLRWLSPFYLLCCVNQIFGGTMRGAGNSKIPMMAALCSFVVFRQIYLFIMANYICNQVIPIALSYPAGWLLCGSTLMLYYRKTKLTKTRIV